MKICVYLTLILLLAVVGAYGAVRLFSRLSGVDMYSLLSWSYTAKHFPFVLIAGFFFVVAAVCFLILLDKPTTLVAMQATHEGSLRGYTDSSGVKLYDPVKREYRTSGKHAYVQAAKTFTDAFGVVAFYRNPRAEYYEDIDSQAQKPWMGAIVLSFVCLTAVAVYMLLYKLAELYIDSTGLEHALSHQAILDNFRQAANVPFPTAAIVVVLIVLIPWLMGGYMVHHIKMGYEEQFVHVQGELRRELMASVAPGKVVRGKMIGRVHSYEEELVSSAEASRRVSSSRWKTVRMAIYTIELAGLVRHTPVYLSIKRRDIESDPDIRRLNQALPAERTEMTEGRSAEKDAAEADAAQKLDFVVNDDYSISLPPEKK